MWAYHCFYYTINKSHKVSTTHHEPNYTVYYYYFFLSKYKYYRWKVTKLGNQWVKLYKPVQTDRFRFGFLGQILVQTGLARFSWFWLGFSGLTRFFSGLAWFFSGLGSVRFFLIKPKPNRTEPASFFKILIGFFFTVWFF